MGRIDDRLAQLGLTLPLPAQVPPDLHLPFRFINLRGDRALISGHARQDADGRINGPYGQVGADLGLDEARDAARDIALSVLSNLRAEIHDLDRVAGWARVFGMVNSAPDFHDQHLVLNGFSDLILEVFGPDIGAHARSAIGTRGLPMNFAIEVEAEVLLA